MVVAPFRARIHPRWIEVPLMQPVMWQKNIIGADLADEVLVQVAYAIGVADPISIHVESYGTGKLPDSRLIDVVQGVFDLRPRAIIERLNLLQPGYVKTAAYGHFGRPGFSWEKLDFVDQLAERAARMG